MKENKIVGPKYLIEKKLILRTIISADDKADALSRGARIMANTWPSMNELVDPIEIFPETEEEWFGVCATLLPKDYTEQEPDDV